MYTPFKIRFNFHITKFPFLSSNIQTSPAYGVFIPQLIRYARACSSYGCFILRATRLSNKLLEQGYVKERLKSSFRKFYDRYGDLQTIWSFPLTNVKWHSVTWPYTMTSPYWSHFVPNSTFYRILSGFHRTFATGVTCRQGTLTPLDTWSRPFETCICSTCWDQSLFRTCLYFSGQCSSNILRFSLDFPSTEASWVLLSVLNNSNVKWTNSTIIITLKSSHPLL